MFTTTQVLTAFKPHAGWLVVGWVTTSESQLLYVFIFLSFLLDDPFLSIAV
jgi:hypothetical protein